MIGRWLTKFETWIVRKMESVKARIEQFDKELEADEQPRGEGPK